MNPTSTKGLGFQAAPHGREQANSRIIVLGVVCFLLGLGISAIWFSHRANRDTAATHGSSGQAPVALSESTKALLRRLDAPVEIRFYSVLDPATVPDSTQAFAGRVEQLLFAYQQAANGNIKVLRFNAESNAVQNAALADGLKPFNLDKGDACYLGLALTLSGRKETLPQLSPDWEPSLESDISRAIAGLLDATSTQPSAQAAARIPPAITQEVKQAIPDVTAVSLEEGTRILREASIKEFKAAGQEMDAKVKEAQQQFLQAQSNGSEADQQAALQHLKQVQIEQQDKLSQIAEKSHLQIEALKQLKAAAR